MGFFVRYPPEGDDHFRAPRVEGRYIGDTYQPPEWHPTTHAIEPEYGNDRLVIDGYRARWEATGSRLYVIEAFRVAAKLKLYPPLWVIEELNQRFSKAVLNNASLDKSFGFSGQGLGSGRRSSERTKASLLWRNYLFCLAVFKLEAAGLNHRKACEALAKALAKSKIQVGENSRWTLARTVISGPGIKKAIKEYSKEFPEAYNHWRKVTMDAGDSWTPSERRELLAPFFPGGIPILLAKTDNPNSVPK